MAKVTAKEGEGNGGVSMPLVALVALLAGLLVGYAAAGMMAPKTAVPTNATAQVDSLKLKSDVGTFLTKLIAVQGGEGVVVEPTGIAQENGMYAVAVNFKQNGAVVQQGKVYVSPDGKFIFDSSTGIDITQTLPEPAAPQPAVQVQKSDKPVMEMFVMSFCPYGKQVEQGIGPVARLLGAKVEIVPHFILYGRAQYAGSEATYCVANSTACSMHGVEEVVEDARQMCVWKYQKAKWWDYVDQVNAKCTVGTIATCWKDAAAAAGVNATQVQECYDAEGIALLDAEKVLAEQKGAQGSPTIFLNGASYGGGRSAENFKASFCAAFNTAPAECSQTLSTAATAAGSCG